MATTSHTALVKAVLDALEVSGVALAWKMQSGLFKNWRGDPAGQIGRPGVPDVCGVLPNGRFLGVEVKTGTGRQSRPQKAFQAFCDESAALYIVFRDTHELGDLIDLIKANSA